MYIIYGKLDASDWRKVSESAYKGAQEVAEKSLKKHSPSYYNLHRRDLLTYPKLRQCTSQVLDALIGLELRLARFRLEFFLLPFLLLLLLFLVYTLVIRSVLGSRCRDWFFNQSLIN